MLAPTVLALGARNGFKDSLRAILGDEFFLLSWSAKWLSGC
jgi:hypothetical protein